MRIFIGRKLIAFGTWLALLGARMLGGGNEKTARS
jgi:hypothetical protein